MVLTSAISRGLTAASSPTAASGKAILLAWTPRVMATLSIPSSLFIIWEALSDHRRGKGTAIQRALVGMSIVDVCASSAWFTSTWAVPVGSGPLARGNIATCNWQGFFLQLAIGAPLYNCSLALYYLLVIRYNWKNEQLVKIEKYVHSFIISFTVGTSIAGLPLTMYNRVGSVCWVIGSPPECGSSSVGPTDEDIPCDRGDYAGLFGIFLFYGPLWLCVLLTVFAMLLIYVQVQRTFGKTRGYVYNDSSNSRRNKNKTHQSFVSIAASVGNSQEMSQRQSQYSFTRKKSKCSSKISSLDQQGGDPEGVTANNIDSTSHVADGVTEAPTATNHRPFIPVSRDSRFNRISIFNPSTIEIVDEDDDNTMSGAIFQHESISGADEPDNSILETVNRMSPEEYKNLDYDEHGSVSDHDDEGKEANSEINERKETESEAPQPRRSTGGNCLSRFFSQICATISSAISQLSISQKQSKQHLFAMQAILYSVSFFITWSPSTIWSVAHWFNVASFGLDFAAAFCEPLQGFWNMLIFIRRRPTSRKKIYHFFCSCCCFVNNCFSCCCCIINDDRESNDSNKYGSNERFKSSTNSQLPRSTTGDVVGNHSLKIVHAGRNRSASSEVAEKFVSGNSDILRSNHEEESDVLHEEEQRHQKRLCIMSNPRRLTPSGQVSSVYEDDNDDATEEDNSNFICPEDNK